MNIKRTPKHRDEDEPPKKLTKLEIQAEEPESERYDFATTIHCRKCNFEIPKEYGNVSSPTFPNTNFYFSYPLSFPLFSLRRHWLVNPIFKHIHSI
jgi:hypothetical protein